MNRDELIAHWDAVVALKNGLEIEYQHPELVWLPTGHIRGPLPHRPKPQPKLRPFTPQEAFDKMWGREVRRKDDHSRRLRVYSTRDEGVDGSGPTGFEYLSFCGLLGYYEFTDGTPCGVRE